MAGVCPLCSGALTPGPEKGAIVMAYGYAETEEGERVAGSERNFGLVHQLCWAEYKAANPLPDPPEAP